MDGACLQSKKQIPDANSLFAHRVIDHYVEFINDNNIHVRTSNIETFWKIVKTSSKQMNGTYSSKITSRFEGILFRV